MSMAAPQKSSRLAQLLAEEKQLLTQFLDITTAQTAIIEGEDTDALTENLELRAKIIDKIDGFRPELDSLLAQYAAPQGSAEGRLIADLRAEISRILTEITEIDQKNQSAARERMEFFQAEIRRADETRKGVGAYLKGAEIFAAEFVDERQ